MSALPRSLTPDEKTFARGTWPNLNVDAVVVTDEQTSAYNCLAWTLGITTSWIWPWNTTPSRSDFDKLYQSYGFNPAANGEVAGFGLSPTAMTHGSISGADHGPRWESKCGQWLRIQHGLGELENGNYGNVLAFYTKTVVRTIKRPPAMELQKNELDTLRAKAAAVPEPLRARFSEAYSRWVKTWSHPLILTSSNPSDRTRSIEFLELVALGRGILPLLMDRLVAADEFFALMAVDQLLPPHQVIHFELEDPQVLGGEQQRAIATVKRWLTVNA